MSQGGLRTVHEDTHVAVGLANLPAALAILICQLQVSVTHTLQDLRRTRAYGVQFVSTQSNVWWVHVKKDRR